MTSRSGVLGVLLAGPIVLLSGQASAQQQGLVAKWSFSEQGGATTQESVSGTQDKVEGYYQFVPGVTGTGLRLDGYTTSVIHRWNRDSQIGERFTVSAWVALNTYPWNWVPVVDKEAQQQEGFFFGVDSFGHIGLQVSVNGHWQSLTSETTIPLKKWAYLAGTFDPARGLTVYLDGKQVGQLSTAGQYTEARRADILIGRVRQPQLPFPEAAIHPYYPVWYSLDAILDDVEIYNRDFSPTEIATAYTAAHAPAGDVLPYPKLPSGPLGPKPFGAYYATLKFQDTWDRPRRIGPDSDVVVTFDKAPIRLVFWQGLNYVPAWVTENGKWYNDQFLEAGGGCPDGQDCEPMSDKQSRYSHVKISESSPARVVIDWRYALSEVENYKGAHLDPLSGWFDWADEYWTIYPDGMAVRKQVLWTSTPKEFYQYQETIVINSPGTGPADNINWDALTLENMQGETAVYTWKPKPPGTFGRPLGPDNADRPTGANIQIVNLKSNFKPFQIVPPTGAHARIYRGENTFFDFECWNHWPVAQLASSGRPCTASDRTSHSSLSSIYWNPSSTTENSVTDIMLNGLTTDSPAVLLGLAKSWISPPKVEVEGQGYRNDGYDAAQRAFVLTKTGEGAPTSVRMTFQASASSPIFNPAILIKDWGEEGATLKINGKDVAWGEDFREGRIQRLDGTDLIVWLREQSTQPIRIELAPAGRSGELRRGRKP